MFICIYHLETDQALQTIAEISRQQLTLEHGPRAAPVARALYQLGKAYVELGHRTASMETLAESLSIDEEHFGLGCAETIQTLLMLASLFKNPADAHRRRDALTRCLELQERLYGSHHASTQVTGQ